jgi:hypothetical protein
MFHFLGLLSSKTHNEDGKSPSIRLIVPWLGLVVAAIAIPWATFSLVGIGSLNEALAPSASWKVLWPLLAAGLLAIALRRWGPNLPAIPSGDVVAWSGRVTNMAAALGAGCERLDGLLRQWQIAGTLLVSAILLLAIVLGCR